MPFPRFRSSCALAVVLALAACNAPSQGLPASTDGSGGAADAALPGDANNVVRPDAHGGDASPAPIDAGGSPGRDAASPDAGRTGSDAGGSSGGDAGSSGSDGSTSSGGGTGTISCYTEGSPDTTCTLPTHCCFTNYSSQHDGACTTDACTWGTIECDGPEDCASGQHCCAHQLVTPDAPVGYLMACQASACGPAPANQEMCHPTTTSAAGTCSSPSSRCVTTFENDNDLPPSLHICQ